MTQQEISDKIVADIVAEAKSKGVARYNMQTLAPAYEGQGSAEVINAILACIDNAILASGCAIEDVSSNDTADEFGSMYIARYDAQQAARDEIEAALVKNKMTWSDLLVAMKCPSTFWTLRYAYQGGISYNGENCSETGAVDLYDLVSNITNPF